MQGDGEGPTIVKVVAPEREYDGRRCHVYFEPAKTAAGVDMLVGQAQLADQPHHLLDIE